MNPNLYLLLGLIIGAALAIGAGMVFMLIVDEFFPPPRRTQKPTTCKSLCEMESRNEKSP